MGIFRCACCDGYYDSHENQCQICPTEEFGLVCEDCYEERDAKDLDFEG